METGGGWIQRGAGKESFEKNKCRLMIVGGKGHL